MTEHSQITTLSHDGRGITHIEGKTAFISGGLPDENVTFKIFKKHRRYQEGRVLDVLTPSPFRVKAECQHFGVCGGCSLQHLQLEKQIEFKQKVLLEQLQHFGNIAPENILPALVGPAWQYRRKARLGVKYVKKKEKLLVGFREKYSNFLTDVTECLVLHPSIGLKITALAELIQNLSQYEYIPQVEVAVADNTTALIFRHLTPLSDEDLEKIKQFGQTHHFTIYLQPNSPEPIHQIWPAESTESLYYALPDYDLKMHFNPLDFIQINGEMNQLMLKQAIDMLAPNAHDTILDLFCGLGNFTLPIARIAERIVGIEGCESMVSQARQNANYNGITNTEFFAANLHKENFDSLSTQHSFNKILLDPPRTGAKEIIPYCASQQPEKIVYVSCNPATLARDGGILVHQHGYRLKQLAMINMFPHTSHIEAIALFEK